MAIFENQIQNFILEFLRILTHSIMDRDIKGQHRATINKLISEYTNTQNEATQQAGWEAFDEWAREKKYVGQRGKGILYKNIKARIDSVHRLRSIDQSLGLLEKEIVKLEEYQTHLDYYKKKVKEYKIKPSQEPNSPFPKTWFVYRFLTDKNNIEPVLARATMTLKDKHNVTFKNVPEYPDYTGTYYINVYTRTIYFDLELIEFEEIKTKSKRRNPARMAHIMVSFTNWQKDTLMLGSYISYEKDQIIRGTVVLEDTNNKAMGTILSIMDNQEEFKKVHPTIKKFLSLRHENYTRIEKNITNFDQLRKHLQERHHEERTHFIEQYTPSIYISYFSSTSIVLDEVDPPPRFEFNRSLRELFDPKYNRLRKYPPRPLLKRLNFIKNTTIFVAFFTEEALYDNIDNALKLGWALNYAKKIIIIYHRWATNNRTSWARAMNRWVDLHRQKENVESIVLANHTKEAADLCVRELIKIVEEYLADYSNLTEN